MFKFNERDRQDFSGEIAITDPCYFFSNDALWTEFVHNIKGSSGVISVGKTKFLYSRTAYGDGSYEVRPPYPTYEGGSFPVDAGLFCVVSVKSVRSNPRLDNNGLEDAVRIKLTGKTMFQMNGNGLMYAWKSDAPYQHLWVDTLNNFYVDDDDINEYDYGLEEDY